MFTDQSAYAVRFEWGMGGVDALSPGADVTVLVDVLSFCTCVDVAVSRGARVFPCRWRDGSEQDFAAAHDALLAQRERCLEGAYSLSPSSLRHLPRDARLVLPSPNGSALSMRAGESSITFAGCLRNRSAVARAAQGGTVAVIACGERWPDGSLRPALEDMLGAGAIIAALGGARSPEAQWAADVFVACGDPVARLRACSSGRELIERGFEDDVTLAAAVDVSHAAPRLVGDAYTTTGA